MRISEPRLVRHGPLLRYECRVEATGFPERLWFEVGEAGTDLVSTSTDAALVGLLVPAMARGEDLRVSGRVSAQLFQHARGPLQAMLQCVIPWLQRIRVEADDVQPAPRGGAGVLTGFSGGIDSFCVLADHLSPSTPPGLRITHLGYHNVASTRDSWERLVRERFARLAPVARRLGLPFVSVNSNLAGFYADRRLFFPQTHTMRNAAAALVLAGGMARYLYASSHTFSDIFVGPTDAMGRSDPISLPLLSTESMQLMPSGSEYTRVEKTLRVAEFAESYESLDVCVWAEERAANCSICWKCMRTLLTLDIAGLLDRYARVFDLDAYRRRRTRFIGEVLQSSSPLMKEILIFARQRGFPLPFRSRLYAFLPLETVRNVKKSLKARKSGSASEGAAGPSSRPRAADPAATG